MPFDIVAGAYPKASTEAQRRRWRNKSGSVSLTIAQKAVLVQKARDAKMTLRAYIAACCNLPPATLPRPADMTPAVDVAARALYEEGNTLGEVASALNCGVKQARDAIVRAGGEIRTLSEASRLKWDRRK